MSLWTSLMPDRQIKDRISRDWIDIGFQGADPATDFRGAGYLGLAQLVKMCSTEDNTVRKRSQVEEMFKDSRQDLHDDHWYFFAVTGLNITQKLLHSLKQGVFDSTLIGVMNSEKGFDLNTILLEVFDYWYFKIFVAFNDKWKNQKPGIMEFNHFL